MKSSRKSMLGKVYTKNNMKPFKTHTHNKPDQNQSVKNTATNNSIHIKNETKVDQNDIENSVDEKSIKVDNHYEQTMQCKLKLYFENCEFPLL